MSIFNLIDPEKISIDTTPMQRGESDFGEIVGDAFDATENNYLAISRTRLLDSEMEDNFSIYRNITGQELKPSLAAGYEPPSKISFFEGMIDNDPLRGQVIKDKRFAQEADYEKKWLNTAINELKTRDPVKFANLKNEKEQLASAAKRAKMSEAKLSDSMNRSPSSISAFTASLVGGGAAMFTDPFNLGATIATAGFGGASLTAARAAGQSVAKTFMTNVLIEAGVNASIEAAQQPIIADWQKEIGNDYGFKDMAANVGLAAIFGGGISAVAQGTQLLASTVFNKLGHYAGFNTKTKTSAKILERDAMNKEANPFVLQKEIDEGRHMDSIIATEQAVGEGRTLQPDELPIKNEEFLTAKTDPSLAKNILEQNQLAELEAFKLKVLEDNEGKFNKEVLADFTAKEKAKQDQIVALKTELATAKRKLESFGDTGKIKGAKQVDVEAGKKSNNLDVENVVEQSNSLLKEIDTIQGKINKLEASVKQKPEVTPKKFTPKQERARESVADFLVDDTPKDIATQQNLLKAIDTPDRIKVIEQDFKRLVEENSNLTITLDDGTTTKLGDLADEFKADAKFQKEITNCAFGGTK